MTTKATITDELAGQTSVGQLPMTIEQVAGVTGLLVDVLGIAEDPFDEVVLGDAKSVMGGAKSVMGGAVQDSIDRLQRIRTRLDTIVEAISQMGELLGTS